MTMQDLVGASQRPRHTRGALADPRYRFLPMGRAVAWMVGQRRSGSKPFVPDRAVSSSGPTPARATSARPTSAGRISASVISRGPLQSKSFELAEQRYVRPAPKFELGRQDLDPHRP